MPYEQKNNPFRKLVSDIGSALGKLNIKSPSMSSSTRGASGQRAYQQAQRKRFGHEKESKFQYDVRMRKEAKKSAESKSIESSTDLGLAEKKSRFSKGVSQKWNPLTKKFESTFDPSSMGLETPGIDIGLEGLLNPNDLRPTGESYVPQEFRGGPGDKFRYRKVGEREEGGNVYSNFEFMDPDRLELGWIPAQSVDGNFRGKNAIFDLFQERKKQGKLFDSPVEHKGDEETKELLEKQRIEALRLEAEKQEKLQQQQVDDEIKKQMEAGAKAAEKKRLEKIAREEAEKEAEIEKKPFDYGGSYDYSRKNIYGKKE